MAQLQVAPPGLLCITQGKGNGFSLSQVAWQAVLATGWIWGKRGGLPFSAWSLDWITYVLIVLIAGDVNGSLY